jgi:cyanuric acid amidohydrolase
VTSTRRAHVHRLATASPDDVAGLRAAFAQGRIDPAAVIAILGKTEGNGCVNDFTRGFATMAIGQALAAAAPATAPAVCLVMSGGTEGGLSPHLTVIESRMTEEPAEAGALAVGRARTRPLPAEDLGRRAQVASVADGVRTAMADAGICDPRDVHFVQVKCPLLTAERVAQAESRGRRTVTRDTLRSMGLSRAASALGVALALGEIDADTDFDAAACADYTLFSGRASTSAGVELAEHEVVVLGTAPGWAGPLRIDHAVMADALDVEPVRAALGRLGLAAQGQLRPDQQARLVAVLAKAEAGSSGRLRGRRHTMLDDSDVSSTRHARAFVAGVLGGLVGHAEIYVSGGAEHQGPDGGGPVALIASSR